MPRMTMGNRLLGTLAVLILLVAIQSGLNLWTTGLFRQTSSDMTTVMEESARIEQQTVRIDALLQRLKQTQAEMEVGQRRLGESILANHAQVRLYPKGEQNPVSQLLESEAMMQVSELLPNREATLDRLRQNHDAMLAAERQIAEQWRQAHPGLTGALNDLKRSYLYWALKFANAIFIKSGVLDLVPESAEETELSQFVESSIYRQYVADFPELAEAVEKALLADRKMVDGADRLSTEILLGNWEEARKVYRDVFPPQVKSLVVDLDRVVAIEKNIAAGHQAALAQLNGPVAEHGAEVVQVVESMRRSMNEVLNGRSRVLAEVGGKVKDQQQALQSGITGMRRLSVLAAVIALLIAVGCGVLIARSITRPLKEVVDNLDEIAQGGGDLTHTLKIGGQHEIGDLARNFNRFVERLGEMVVGIRAVAGYMVEGTGQIKKIATEVDEGTKRQSSALDESYRALQGIEEDVSGIADSTDLLLNAARESSSATLELSATSEEIDRQMQRLAEVVEEVSYSMQNVAVNSQQISASVESFESSTETAAVSMEQLTRNISEIEKSAEQSKRLSGDAADNARRGCEAVHESISGINELVMRVEKAAEVVTDLGGRSEQISTILSVIDDVADQTSLLALNATIIAAQAGENGKGFAVVAEEIRDLADRTASSTREIAGIISSVKSGVAEAVEVMEAGRRQARREAERSSSTGDALEKIGLSTEQAMQQVLSIVQAAHEQASGSQQVNQMVQRVKSMLEQIVAAIAQQAAGIDKSVQAITSMRDISSQVQKSTREQGQGTQLIGKSIEQIEEMIRRINNATRDQSQRNRQVVEAVSEVRQVAEANAVRTGDLEQVVAWLSSQSAELSLEVGAFKVADEHDVSDNQPHALQIQSRPEGESPREERLG